MEVDDDGSPENVLPNASKSIGSSHEEEVAEQLRDIIYRNRKRSQSSALRSPLPPKRSSLDSACIRDPRLQNKYGLNVKSPFVIHMEKILPRLPPSSQARDSEATETNNNIKTGTDNLDNNTSNAKLTSNNGTYGIIAFGKRINRHISNFLSAFDLKTIGKNKFSVTFPDGNAANKFCDTFNEKSNIIFPSEIWIAYVPNYKVIRQFIIRGVDDDDSTEDLIKNVRPPPEWNILWQPPFEAVRLKKPIRTRDSNNISSTKYIESDTYVVRFRTLSVPPSVIYMGKRCYLTPFIEKVRRCQRCQRFGHVARFCRTPDRNAVCQRCGKLVTSHGSSNNVNEPCSAESPSCINCKRHKLPDNDTVHEASSNSCPIFQKQRRIKKLMAFHGISQSEAMSMLERADPQLQQTVDNNYTRSHPLPTLGEFLPYALPKSYAEAVSRNNHTSHFNFSIPSSEVSVKHFPSIVKPQFSTDDLPAKSSINRKSQDVGSQHKRRGPESSLIKSPSTSLPPTSRNFIQDININKCPSNKTVNHKNSSISTSNSPVNDRNAPDSNSKILNDWIRDCQKKFSETENIQADILSQMGALLLRSTLYS